MTGLLHRVKTKLSIHSHRRVRGMLDGEYASIFQGKSHDFDDLRPYAPGDEIKDIDWKATARHGSPLIKRYVATRKHGILLVVDSGRDLAATSASGAPKREIAVFVAGVMGYLALRHGDYVGLVTGDANGSEHLPLKGTESHLERILAVIDRRATLSAGPSKLAKQLEFVARTFRRRMILVVIADDGAMGGDDSEKERKLLRRLHAQHEILWVTIGDADLTREEYASLEMFDVADDRRLPAFLRGDERLREEFIRSVAARAEASEELLEKIGITSQRVTGDNDVIERLFRLLEVHNHAKR